MVKFSGVEMISCVLFGVWRGCLVSMAGGVAVLLRSETTLDWQQKLEGTVKSIFRRNLFAQLH